MAKRFLIILQSRLPILAGVHSYASVSSYSNNPCADFSTTLKRSNILRSQLVLEIRVSFGAQFMSMAGNSSTNFVIRTKGAVEQMLTNVEWPEHFPFKEEDFHRLDESSDLTIYGAPRFVTHIDDLAIASLTRYYKEAFPPSNSPGVALLDMCSSWVSHFPAGYKQQRIAGMGLNEEELKANKVLTEYVVQDLHTNPKLPFEDNSFDVITNVVSVDYLTKPIDVFKEMCRVLKPGGKAIMSDIHMDINGYADHVMIVAAYFHYAGGFEPPQAVNISPNPGRSDPMYIVHSRKLAKA